jgi:hypothetical protein
MKLALAALAAAAWTVSTASAVELAYEGFDYQVGAGNLQNQNGGTGWGTNSWGNGSGWTVIDANTDPNPMTYSGIPSTGNRVTLASNVAYQRIQRNFDVAGTFAAYNEAGQIGADGTSLWVSFLLQGAPGNTQGNHVVFTDSFLNNRTGLVNIGHTNGVPNPNNPARIGLWTGTGANSVSMIDEPGLNQDGTAQLMLAEFIFGAGNNDTVNLYVNEDAAGDPTTFVLDATLSGYDMSFDRMYLDRADTRGDVYGFDEFRFGETVYDVLPNAIRPSAAVPEPGSIALCTLLGLVIGAVGHRRRRR